MQRIINEFSETRLMNTKALLITGVVLLGLFISACGGSNDPIPEPVPVGEWFRAVSLKDGRVHHSTVLVARDSACINDTVFSFPGGVPTIDSAYAIRMELTPSGDGYFRAVEEHTASGSDVVEEDLRYWFFFVRDDSLYFYQGMRLRGRNTGVKGDWNLSAADSAFLGASYSYSFDGDNVKITSLSPAGTNSKTYPYQIAHDTLSITGDDLPPYGSRYEIVPGLALYLTAHEEAGYAPLWR